MSTVALAGDWHGNTRGARAHIAEAAANGVSLILHLGDFGIWPGASVRVYIDQVEDALCRAWRRDPGDSRQPRGLGAEEAIRPEDVAKVVEGGYADVMLAHDAPLAPYEVPSVAAIRSTRGVWSERATAYARVGAERMHQAFLGVHPRLFAHGRYHVSDETTVELPD